MTQKGTSSLEALQTTQNCCHVCKQQRLKEKPERPLWSFTARHSQIKNLALIEANAMALKAWAGPRNMLET